MSPDLSDISPVLTSIEKSEVASRVDPLSELIPVAARL